MTDTQWTVRSTNANDRRVHFAGTEADARAHVENNFPRVHVADANAEPYPDVALHSPDGAVRHYVSGEWQNLSALADDAVEEE